MRSHGFYDCSEGRRRETGVMVDRQTDGVIQWWEHGTE